MINIGTAGGARGTVDTVAVAVNTKLLETFRG